MVAWPVISIVLKEVHVLVDVKAEQGSEKLINQEVIETVLQVQYCYICCSGGLLLEKIIE